MPYRYLVLGTGVGKAIVHRLLKWSDTAGVVVADMDFSRAEEAVRFVGEDSRCRPAEFRAGRHVDPALFREFDVVISALPARYSFRLASSAIGAGVHFCDLGGVVDMTRKLISLNEYAHAKKVSVIPDCGLMPGLGLQLARLLVEKFDCTDSIRILAGGLPQKPVPPVFYQRVFSLEGLRHICYDAAPVLLDGEIMWRDPFSDYERLIVWELAEFSDKDKFKGEVEAFTTAGAALGPWIFRRLGVKNFVEKTIRWPGFVKFVKKIPKESFESEISPHINIPVDDRNPDLVWMNIEASGTKGGETLEHSFTLFDLFDPATGLTAMERTTGFSAALVARMMARGEARYGVNTPECAFTVEGLRTFLQDMRDHFSIAES